MEVVEETLQPEGAQEGYTLSVKLEDEHVTVNILATTYFGARSVIYYVKARKYIHHIFSDMPLKHFFKWLPGTPSLPLST